jgi:hypothetical protein
MESVESQISEWRAYVANAAGVNGHDVDELDRMERRSRQRRPVAQRQWSAPAHLRGLPGWAR